MLLKIGLIESQLVGQITATLKHNLRVSLSYENKGQIIKRAISIKRYGYVPKNLQWSGVTYLYNDKKSTFPTGLVPQVKRILKKLNIEYVEVIDYKIKEPVPMPLAIQPKLRYYQREAIEAIKENKRGIIKAGTGAGKTVLSVVAASEIGQFPLLFVVSRVSLLKQAHDEYTRFFNQKIGYIGNGVIDCATINIATVNTLCSILKIEHAKEENDEENVNYTPEQIVSAKNLMNEARCVIEDECHHSASDMYINLLKNLPNATYRIGLSATPGGRTDGLDILIYAAFGDIIYSKSSSELIKEGFLAKPYIYFCEYDDPLTKIYPYGKTASKKSQYRTVYKECVVENDLFNNKIAKLALTNAKMGRATIVSVKQIAHGDNIVKEIKKIDADAKVVFLHGKNKDILGEDQIKEDFSSHKIEILVSTLLDEGVDIPAIDAVIDAGGGSSPIKTIQLTGRAMRMYAGKKRAYIYCFIQKYTHLYNHSLERLKTLKSESEYSIQKIKI